MLAVCGLPLKINTEKFSESSHAFCWRLVRINP